MLLAVSANQRASERWGVSVIYFNNFQYNKAVEQRRVDPVVRTGPKSVLALSRMSSAVRLVSPHFSLFKIAKKNFGDKILAIFRSKKGGLG